MDRLDGQDEVRGETADHAAVGELPDPVYHGFFGYHGLLPEIGIFYRWHPSHPWCFVEKEQTTEYCEKGRHQEQIDPEFQRQPPNQSQAGFPYSVYSEFSVVEAPMQRSV